MVGEEASDMYSDFMLLLGLHEVVLRERFGLVGEEDAGVLLLVY